jgi:bacterial/archaeal transporter family protein
MMKLDYRLILLAGLTIIMWGCWGFFGKVALDRKMAPVNVFLAEILISAICAIPIAIVQFHRPNGSQFSVQWNVYGLLSGAGLALGLIFYYMALRRSQASVVVPLTATYPLISVALSRMFLNEQFRLPQVIGVLLVVAGTILLLSNPTVRPDGR